MNIFGKANLGHTVFGFTFGTWLNYFYLKAWVFVGVSYRVPRFVSRKPLLVNQSCELAFSSIAFRGFRVTKLRRHMKLKIKNGNKE